MNAKTKIAIGLGLLDITRQAAHAFSAKQEADRNRLSWGAGFRSDAAQLAHDMRDRMPAHPLDVLPWRSHTPTAADRMRTWAPVAVTVVAATAAVVVTARHIARQDPDVAPEDIATDTRMMSAARIGSKAIDAGVEKVVGGSRAGAVTAAAAVAAGSSAASQAAVQRAKVELDERVIAPVKKKAVLYGSLAAIGLTVYIVAIAVAVQLLVDAIG
ncbi:MAG: hypothetical protein JWM90_329 [Thermoleophilia bacterium]|nr:hypothetical protein [Thermoleophilia bacterium]